MITVSRTARCLRALKRFLARSCARICAVRSFLHVTVKHLHTKDQRRIEKMKVLITGGSRGIGAACVRTFCERGDSVAFLYRVSEEEATSLSLATGAHAIRADISRPEEVRTAVAEAQKILGGIDVLVNNAGIAQIKLFTELEDADWRRMIDTNLSGAFYVTREAAKTMIANHSGFIVNIGSMWGKVGASCEVHYSAAKAGLRGMTMALAKELGPSGIT
ncbi:MAG: SDR family NAD(P)-dependent oxidoreductase, partial [Ruminococcaceae bacterium]|nr:SDR family NAD(P)-dependent oxidoreductase [Oscillospiraceae bacterium]